MYKLVYHLGVMYQLRARKHFGLDQYELVSHSGVMYQLRARLLFGLDQYQHLALRARTPERPVLNNIAATCATCAARGKHKKETEDNNTVPARRCALCARNY